MTDDVREPGPCLFCEWDHPGDPPHRKSCAIGRHVAFAVAEERRKVVAYLEEKMDMPVVAARIEAGRHHE
jgi:hypothetical protein